MILVVGGTSTLGKRLVPRFVEGGEPDCRSRSSRSGSRRTSRTACRGRLRTRSSSTRRWSRRVDAAMPSSTSCRRWWACRPSSSPARAANPGGGRPRPSLIPSRTTRGSWATTTSPSIGRHRSGSRRPCSPAARICRGCETRRPRWRTRSRTARRVPRRPGTGRGSGRARTSARGVLPVMG